MTNNSLYESSEWKSIDGVDRAQLLLVIEGLKRGTTINGNWTTLIDILNRTNLSFELNNPNDILRPVFTIAKQKILEERNQRFLQLKDTITNRDWYKIDGWFFSYPDCCVEEYSRKRTPLEKEQKTKGARHLSYTFGRELDELIKSSGNYPEIFDFKPPTFTPCSINCPSAIETLTIWKDAIESQDPDAAKS